MIHFFKKFQAQILHLTNEVSLMETITSALCRGFFKENDVHILSLTQHEHLADECTGTLPL